MSVKSPNANCCFTTEQVLVYIPRQLNAPHVLYLFFTLALFAAIYRRAGRLKLGQTRAYPKTGRGLLIIDGGRLRVEAYWSEVAGKVFTDQQHIFFTRQRRIEAISLPLHTPRHLKVERLPESRALERRPRQA